MSSYADVPNCIAGGNISPFRVVKVSTSADNTLLAAGAVTEQHIVGVTDGSLSAFNGTYHAVAGDPVTLQGGNVVVIEAGGSITRGARVEVTTGGKVITETATTGNAAFGWVALESATGDGCKIRCIKALNATKLS